VKKLHWPLLVSLTVAAMASPVAVRQAHAAENDPTKAGVLAFGPGTLGPNGQNVNLCTVNWGDRSRTLVLAIVNAENTTVVLASKLVTLQPGAQACLAYTNVSPGAVGAASSDPTAVEFVGVIYQERRERDENGGRAAFNSLAATLEMGDGSVRGGPNRLVFLPRVLDVAADLLPAVQ